MHFKRFIVCLIVALFLVPDTQQSLVKTYLEKIKQMANYKSPNSKKSQEKNSSKKVKPSNLPLGPYKQPDHKILERIGEVPSIPKMSKICKAAVKKYEDKLKAIPKGKALMAAANAF